jgi:hypothetical protein
MILKSFGCSFIFGSDLADSKKFLDTQNKPVPSQVTWPALLANYLSIDYQCFASPGCGNFKIFEKVLTQSADSADSIFVIGWSFIDRYDYLVPTYDYKEHYDPINNEFWSTVNPTDLRETSKNYYRNLHSQFCDKLKSLTYIKCAIDILKQKNIPFVMTYMDNLLFETEWHTTPAITTMQKYVRPFMTTFEDQTFLEFSQKNGFPISKNLHPLETAHQAAFELIKSYNLV